MPVGEFRRRYFSEYNTWTAMRCRCSNPKHRQYRHYGGRGITVCERWSSFEAFMEDMGPRPPGLTLERKNNNGNYEPDNCCWATYLEQNHNQRSYVRTNKYTGATHCAHGHSFSGENLRLTADGNRRCRTCDRAYAADYRERMARGLPKRAPGKAGADSPLAKLTLETVKRIRSGEITADQAGISSGQFYKIKTGKSWAHNDYA